MRRDAGISQEKFAGRLDVSQQTASRWKTTADIRRRKSDANRSDVSGETGYLLKDNLSDNVSQGNGGYYVSRELAEGFLRTDQRRSFRLALGVALSIAATSLTFVSNGVLGLFVYLLAAIAAVALIISQKMAGNPYVRLLAKNEEHWFRTDPDGAANRVGTLIRKQNDDL